MKSEFHWVSLALAILIMITGTFYPPLMADAQGNADHYLAMFVLWAMSSGFIHGVGFIPRTLVLRWLFSGWAVGVAMLSALLLKYFH